MNQNAYIEVFFDTEFTHFQGSNINKVLAERNPAYNPAKSELISIGFASECGQTFYAESEDFNYGLCSQFVLDHVLPHLEGGAARMSLENMARGIKDYINGFDLPVRLISDAPDFDWPFLEDLFEIHGFPHNLRLMNAPTNRSPVIESDLNQVGASSIVFHSANQQRLFLNSLQKQQSAPGFRHHHALDDAVANMKAYMNSQ